MDVIIILRRSMIEKTGYIGWWFGRGVKKFRGNYKGFATCRFQTYVGAKKGVD
jgi:hypothetical protein